MSYMIFDIECDCTTVRKRFGDPLEQEHTIVMLQAKEAGKPPKLLYKPEGIDRNIKLTLDPSKVLVGHNIKFDLLYLYSNQSLQEWIALGGKIWDTCLAEFLLEGQNKMLRYDMSSVAVRYGGTPKLDVVKEHLDSGEMFSTLAKETALKYGAKDVIDTEFIYLQQLDRAKRQGMTEILQVHMQHLLALCEIEYNGLFVDIQKIAENTEIQEAAVAERLAELQEIANDNRWPSHLIEFDPQKNEHISAILFGGKIKYETVVPNPTSTGITHWQSGAKKGQLRTKKSVDYVSFPGLGIQTTAETKKEGVFETGNNSLKYYKDPAVKKILNYRKEFKLISTYLRGYPPLINPYTGCIHSEFRSNGTATGRVASRNPNVQNLHPRLLECFKSRFEGGKIVEMDFSQLEVCVAAWIFNDGLLLSEIQNELDLHYNNAVLLFGKEDIDSKERKLAKFLTFGLLYGQGAKTMAVIHDIEEEIGARFIEVFYNKYLDIAEGHKKLPQEANINRQGDTSFLSTPTRRRYCLHLHDSKWGKKFSPSEMKNYKIQGTASDVVATAIGNVFKYLHKYKKWAIMINEVHDSLILDVHPECPPIILQNVQKIMESASLILTKHLGVSITIPLKVDVESGSTWKECKK